jgi:tRNA(fMet)-specific endonuclease VapC
MIRSSTRSCAWDTNTEKHDDLARPRHVIVLDSDILSLVQRKSGNEYARLVARLDSIPKQPVVVTIITFEEQMRGWLAYVARARSIERQITAYSKLHELLRDFQTRPVLDFDDVAAVEFQRLTRSRVRIGTMDLKIAAIVMAHGATLYSRNTVDFSKIAGLSVEDPII